jgi:hypothetical protein
MSDIVKKPDPPSGSLMLNKGKLRSTSSPFQQRVNEARGSVDVATTMPNRLCLMLDRSSSMSAFEDKKNNKQRIDLLKDAVENFGRRCDFTNTSVAIETFPPGVELQLSTMQSVIITSMFGIQASGNTPMKACVEVCLEKVPMTRGIIVSDGEATDWHDVDDEPISIGEIDEPIDTSKVPGTGILFKYRNLGIPIDCVHIGDSTSGEELLRRIAKETGGIYLKFTDVSAFATAFAYLTPGYRAMLTSGRVTSQELGAKELKR